MGKKVNVLGIFDHFGLVRDPKLKTLAANGIEGPYRIDLVSRFSIDLFPITPLSVPSHKKIRDVIEHRSGVKWDLFIRGLRDYHYADIVFTMLEDKAVAPSLFYRWHLLRKGHRKLATLSCWWAEELLNGSQEQQDGIRRTLELIDRVYVLSDNQVQIFQQFGGVPKEKIVPIDFGVDEDLYSPGDPCPYEFEVFAAGIDRGRDFKTLAEAAALLPNIRFTIVTQPIRLEGINLPSNIEVLPPTDRISHRDNLRKSKIVVVPTHDLAYPTGQSVLLEAYGCGRPTVSTMTAAMSQYLMDGKTTLSYEPHNAESLAECIQALMVDENLAQKIGAEARKVVLSRFNFNRMWSEISSDWERLATTE